MQFGLFGGARTERSVMEADRLGFRQLFIVEHHFAGHGQVSTSMTVLAYFAAKTRNIRLGTAMVVPPWHNPALVAEQVATVDLLSGRPRRIRHRKGYRQAEFDGFCIPIDEATERLHEEMELIRKALPPNGRFSHHGKRWHTTISWSNPSRCSGRYLLDGRPTNPWTCLAGGAASISKMLVILISSNV